MGESFYKLTLVTNRQDTPLKDYLYFISRCASAGITAVQLREKHQSRDFLLMFGRELKRILDPLHIPLIVNDDLKLALELDASGVHLGQSDGDPAYARKILGPQKIIGVSIDTRENLLKANTLPIDYVGIGAIFATPSKKDVSTIWGIKGLQALSSIAKHPIVGIGGININNAATTMASGAHGIAVIGALHDADDPTHATKQLRYIIDHGGSEHAG
jgi:thiamine-phosphate pyrophosphorylase